MRYPFALSFEVSYLFLRWGVDSPMNLYAIKAGFDSVLGGLGIVTDIVLDFFLRKFTGSSRDFRLVLEWCRGR
jgi:hypothetical protein